MIQRPLSPHLQIYRLQITSGLSILHRITGMILSSSIIAIIIWLIAAGQGADTYYLHQKFYHRLVGKYMLLIWLSCFYFHLFNGIRHLAWDMGYGFKIETVEQTGITVIILMIVMAILTFIAIF